MINLIRWIFKQFKKEFKLLSRYERAHPHFFWFMGLDALISVVLVVVGFQLFSSSESSNPFEQLLERSGGFGMSADKLIDRVKADDGDAYWLGPISGMTNTVGRSVDGVEVVSYLVKGVGNQDSGQSKLTVETFESPEVYAAHVHALTGAETKMEVVEKGMTVQFDTSSLNAMTVRLTGAPEIVVVNYPTKQDQSQLLQDAAKIRVVQ